MLDFELNEEQKMLADAINRLSTERIRKVFRDADEEGNIPADVVRAGWEMGLVPSSIPESYGGFGEHSAVTGAVAMEEFAYGDLAVTFNISTPGLVAIPVLLAGTEAQKVSYLPQFCEEAPPAMTAAFTEPVIRFDPYHLGTKAVRDGDSYVLNGVKTMVPLADTADLILVYAQEEGQTQAFFVPHDAAGLEIGDREKLMGIRALPVHRLILTDCRIPAENKLGGEAGIDFGLILNHSRVALGAAAVGLARAGFEYARNYAKNRIQFGEPIAYRQSIAFMLAEMAIDVDAARLLVWEAAWKLDHGEDATRETAVMKNYVDHVVLSVADRAVQTLGGYGYIREFPAELWLRNARGFASFDGLAIV
ncbi:MAG: acyl-CoA dehydrogenase family protein [Candidatus Promineifilaceae bacterium]